LFLRTFCLAAARDPSRNALMQAHALPALSDQSLGRIRNYDVVRRLATGGMAEVFLAWQTGAAGFRRQVVLKRIHPHIASDPSFVQMFLNEARLAASMSHPNIVHFYEFFTDAANASYVMAMEYADGETAQSILREAAARKIQLPRGAVVRIVSAIC